MIPVYQDRDIQLSRMKEMTIPPVLGWAVLSESGAELYEGELPPTDFNGILHSAWIHFQEYINECGLPNRKHWSPR